MVRAVRLAATLEFAIEPATLEAIRAQRGARRPTSRASGSAPSSRSCSRRHARRVGLRLAEETGLLAVLAARARRAARHPAEQGARARTCGSTRCGRSMRPPRPVRSSAWQRWSTTSASRRRSPTGTSTTTTWWAPGWPTDCSAGSGCPGGHRRRRRTSSATTCSRRIPTSTDAAIRRFTQAHRRARHLDDLFALRRGR